MQENTLRDPQRWKKHYWSAKRTAYKASLGSDAFRTGYDGIRWGQSFDIKEPSEGRMVYCSDIEGLVMFHAPDDYVLKEGERFVERA